jgi:hypothetical protein
LLVHLGQGQALAAPTRPFCLAHAAVLDCAYGQQKANQQEVHQSEEEKQGRKIGGKGASAKT